MSAKSAIISIVIASLLTTSTLAAVKETPTLASPLISRLSDECVVAPDIARGGLGETALLGALAATLLPKVIGGIYNWVTGLVSKAAEKKEITKDTSTGGYFYRVRAQGKTADMRGCLQVFTLGPAGTTWESLAADSAIGMRVRDALKLKTYPGPNFFLEFVIIESADKQYFRLVPTHLKMVSSFSGSRRDTALVAAITMSVPAAKDPFASDAFKIAGIRPGAPPYDLATLVGTDGKWSVKPTYSDSLQTRLSPSQATALSAQVFNPVNISVAVTETQEANALLQSVATALGEGQKDVVTAIGAELPTQANREAADTEAVDEKNAFVEASAAALVAIEEEKVADLTRAQAQKALDAATSAEERAKAQLALAGAEASLKAKQAATIKAKGAANKAAIKARVPQPYPQIYS